MPQLRAQGAPLLSPTPTPPQGSCRSGTGRILLAQINDPVLPRPLPYRVYLPPCYDQEPASYPTLYLLHGLGADDGQWDALGVDEAADGLISAGRLPALIIVMPWHRSGVDLELAVVELLVQQIDASFRTRAEAAWRAIGGVSRGGGEALQIGLNHPEVFSTIGLHSPANLFTAAMLTAWHSALPSSDLPRLWIDIGDRDPLYGTTLTLISWIRDLRLPLRVTINAGTHDPEYWSARMSEYLLWYGSRWITLNQLETFGALFPLQP